MPLKSTYAPEPGMTGVTLLPVLLLFALTTAAFVMWNPGDGLVGAVTRRAFGFPLPGVVLVALIQNETVEFADAVFTGGGGPSKFAVVGPVELTWNLMVLVGAARLGNVIAAISSDAATVAKSMRRFQPMLAAMWNSFPSVFPIRAASCGPGVG